jgi:opacity protein-like surface antigen
MKKSLLVFVVMVAILCSAAMLQAQSKARDNKTQIGIGLVIFDRSLFNMIGSLSNVSLSDAGAGLDVSSLMPPSRIHVPINMGSLKIEPEFGLYRTSSSNETASLKTTQTITALRIGGGVFLVGARTEKVEVYLGGRIGIVRVSDNNKFEPKPSGTSTETGGSQTNLFLGPSIGGEYYITGRVSFGGEAQLMYTKFGNYKAKNEKDSDNENKKSSSLLDTRYFFIMRWYLN